MVSMRRVGIRMTVTLVAVLVLLAGTSGGDAIPVKQSLAAPYQFDVAQWEVTHFLSKWWRQLVGVLPGVSSNAEERERAIETYFALAEQARSLRGELEKALADPAEGQRVGADLQARLDDIEKQRNGLRSVVEEALEAEVTSVIAEMGIDGKLGPVRWPPVDFALEASPLLLVTSPRHEVRRLDDVVLRSSISLLDQERLEGEVEAATDFSALVVHPGGIATYPAHVSPTGSLHGTLVLASHEWLHHHLFFRPLGVRWFAGGDMASINETVADIAGREIGDRVFTKLTGQAVERPPYTPPSLEPPEGLEPGAFDFSREMRETRIRLEELLVEGLVAEAEAYLEQRRQRFVANEFSIRKLNTAYFAFHGTYADSPASVSQIEPQLQAVRANSGSLAEFLRRVSGISSAGELEAKAREAGWEPPEAEAG